MRTRREIKKDARDDPQDENARDDNVDRLNAMQNALGAVISGGRKINGPGRLGRFLPPLPSIPSIPLYAW